MYSYPQELLTFAESNHINLPGVKTIGGQALAFLAQPENRGGNRFITPSETVEFFRDLGLETRDSIQPFNKVCSGKLKLVDAKSGLYSLEYPFALKWNDISKRISVNKHVLENGSKKEQVAEVKRYWIQKMTRKEQECRILLDYLRIKWSKNAYDYLIEKLSEIKWAHLHILSVPIDRWQIGHLDASKGNEPENLFYQPPIQARFRDNYIFNRQFEKIKVKV